MELDKYFSQYLKFTDIKKKSFDIISERILTSQQGGFFYIEMSMVSRGLEHDGV